MTERPSKLGDTEIYAIRDVRGRKVYVADWIYGYDDDGTPLRAQLSRFDTLVGLAEYVVFEEAHGNSIRWGASS